MTRKTKPANETGLPALTPRELEQAMQEEQQAIAASRRRYWPAGSMDICPECGQRTFVGRDDMTVEVPRPPVVFVFRGMRGAECTGCRAQCVESADLAMIEEKIADVPDYQVKISSLAGGRSLGTYWPADVVRNLGLSPGEVARLQVLSETAALLRIERSAPTGVEGRRRPLPVTPRKRRRTTN